MSEVKNPFNHLFTKPQLDAFIGRVEQEGLLVGSRAIPPAANENSDWDYLVKGWQMPEIDVRHLRNYAEGTHPTAGLYLEHQGKKYNILFALTEQEHEAWVKTQATWLRMLRQSPLLFSLVTQNKKFRVSVYQALRDVYGLVTRKKG